LIFAGAVIVEAAVSAATIGNFRSGTRATTETLQSCNTSTPFISFSALFSPKPVTLSDYFAHRYRWD
jgi:hypothetical protein